jgi:hypothetical protein
MTKSCPLKTAFIASKLDEIQPDWREGADVKQETKNSIQAYAQKKYRNILEDILEEPDESISLKSIENAIGRARKAMKIVNAKGKRNSPVRGSSDNSTSKTDEIAKSEETPEGVIPVIKKIEFDPSTFSSDFERAEDEFDEDKKEVKLKLTLQPDVRKVLESYKNGTTKEGRFLRTYNNAIRYAFKEAGLWDIPF